MEEQGQHRPPNPMQKASYFSKYISYWWLNGIFRIGCKRTLENSDIYQQLPEDEVKLLTDKLESFWNQETTKAKYERRKPQLSRAIVRFLGINYLLVGIYVLLEESTRLIQPVFIGKLISFFVPGSTMSRLEAYGYAAVIIFCSLSMTVLHHPLFFKTMRMGMQLRAAAGCLVYRKAIRLSFSAFARTTTGHIVNLVTSDIQKFEQLTLFLHYLWAGPLAVIIIGILGWHELGPACLPGIALLILTAPFQGFVGQYFAVLRKKIASLTDERIKIMNEVISGMRVIKMYTWEDSFAELVAFVRKKESSVIKQANRARALNSSLYLGIIPLASLVMFTTYVMTGHTLTATKVFTVIGLLFSVKLLLSVFIPNAVMFLRESFISEARLQRFLLLEEKEQEKAYKKISVVAKPESPVLKVNNISASWTTDLGSETLSDISFEVKPGELWTVVGPVGCGKSSLLMAILGEMPLTKGSVEVKGSIGYASQQAWIFSGSVRENIVFGHDFDEVRYKKTIFACALEKDLALLPNGDQTLVGERGVSLSGGQRARINLARAVYYDGDIYLLDDPLSAVDTHVAKHLFKKCIRGMLKEKICILVTHQLQFVGKSSGIICIDEGRCINQGTYAKLIERGFDVSSLVSGYEDADSAFSADRTTTQDALPPHAFLMPERNTPQPSSLISLRPGPIKRSLSEPGGDGVFCKTRSETVDEIYITTSMPNIMDRELEPVEVKESAGMENEERRTGTVTMSVYKDYFRAGGSLPVLFIMFLLMISAQAVVMLSEWWLAYWADAEEKIGYELSLATNSTSRADDSQSTRNRNIIIYTILVFCGFTMAFLRSFLFLHVTVSASQNLHNSMFAKLLKAPIYFFDNNPLGRILNRFSKDICQMDDLLPSNFYDFLQLFVMAVSIVLLNVVGMPYLLVVAVPIAAVFVYLRNYYIKTSREVKRIEAVNRSPVYSHLSVTLQGLTTVRAFKAQNRFVSMYHVLQDSHTSSWFMFMSSSRWLGARLDFISLVFITLATLAPLVLKESGTVVSAGVVGLCLTYARVLTGMFQYCIRLSAEVESVMTSVERVLEYSHLEQEPQMLTAEKVLNDWPKYGVITAERMSYAHHRSLPFVLKNLNFCIRASEKVGVVGRTGAGKSTLMAALFRMAEPTGLIRIDGIAITDINLHDLRSRLSIIPQDPVLFTGTLAKNLDPFDEHPDYALWDALDEVQLKDFVEGLPGKLEAELAEAGSNFSVGQRQLVCLARAILRHNKILIIDEATANVDHDTDILVQETIRNKFRECTVLTIAHRLNTIMDSDRVMVLDEGKLAEFDEPYLLLKNPETLFYKMAEQTGKSSAAKLLETARQAYEMRHEGSMDSIIELPRTDIVVVDGSDHREEESCDENEPLLIFESSV